MYIKPHTGRVLTRAAFTFGTRLPAFKAACEKMQALPMKHGDAGYQFDLIGGYRMQILVWEGDDEFPPTRRCSIPTILRKASPRKIGSWREIF